MKQVEMRIYGMTCDDCVVTVKRGLKAVNGVLDAEVSLKEGKAIVKVDETKVNPENLENAEVFRTTRYRGEVRKIE
ncbi:heavy-metal-associated domain-containing protein [Thermoplasma sp.]|uniref:heavy-metal-associated domain-containing protein n=1 Tax=Thermoplasma sp. TaxID=1973142 RepID=UPI002631290B|nr:heavy-metal-associated domain-containing protein [Thermoplasma sp.]